MSKTRLPENFASSGDPVDGNPFPPEDFRHQVWAAATREAEEKVARINARRLSSLEALPAHEFVQRETALPVGRFDAWAERGIKVVLSDAAMFHYDAWLVSYANALLEAFGEQYKSTPVINATGEQHAPTRDIPIRASLTGTLLGCLGARVQHWKAEARRYRGEQERYAAEQESRAQAHFQPPPTVSAAVKKRRRGWLKKYRDDNGLTVRDLSRKVGISETAIRGIANEDRSRFAEAKRDSLLKALGIPLSAWYEP